MFSQPSAQSERQDKKGAFNLVPIPQTIGELWEYSEAWFDEMSYIRLHNHTEDTQKSYDFANYQAELFSWLVLQIRKQPEHTPEHRFDIELIQKLKDVFDRSFPEKVKPEHHLFEKIDKAITDFNLAAPNAIQNLKDAISDAVDELADDPPR